MSPCQSAPAVIETAYWHNASSEADMNLHTFAESSRTNGRMGAVCRRTVLITRDRRSPDSSTLSSASSPIGEERPLAGVQLISESVSELSELVLMQSERSPSLSLLGAPENVGGASKCHDPETVRRDASRGLNDTEPMESGGRGDHKGIVSFRGSVT